MPLTCKGRVRGVEQGRGDIDFTLGRFSLTLIDTLDTLAVSQVYTYSVWVVRATSSPEALLEEKLCNLFRSHYHELSSYCICLEMVSKLVHLHQ